MSLSNKTHYALLGVGNDADTETIDRFHRHLQQEYPAERWQELQTRLQLLAEAHACSPTCCGGGFTTTRWRIGSSGNGCRPAGQPPLAAADCHRFGGTTAHRRRLA